MNTGQLKATELLARLLVELGRDDVYSAGVGVGETAAAQGGIAATVELPSSDRFVVVVQWLGDRESLS